MISRSTIIQSYSNIAFTHLHIIQLYPAMSNSVELILRLVVIDWSIPSARVDPIYRDSKEAKSFFFSLWFFFCFFAAGCRNVVPQVSNFSKQYIEIMTNDDLFASSFSRVFSLLDPILQIYNLISAVIFTDVFSISNSLIVIFSFHLWSGSVWLQWLTGSSSGPKLLSKVAPYDVTSALRSRELGLGQSSSLIPTITFHLPRSIRVRLYFPILSATLALGHISLTLSQNSSSSVCENLVSQILYKYLNP